MRCPYLRFLYFKHLYLQPGDWIDWVVGVISHDIAYTLLWTLLNISIFELG